MLWLVGLGRNCTRISAKMLYKGMSRVDHDLKVSRCMAHIINGPDSPPEVDHFKVSPHLTLRKLKHEASLNEKRGKPETLVVMFPWLYASPKAVEKYCELYHRRGMNVISVSCDLKHFLWPATANTVATEVLEYLSNNDTPLNTDTFLIHTFSIGAYVYTVMLMNLMKQQPKYDGVLKKIQGQVLDSLCVGGLGRMSNGIASQATNPLTAAFIKGAANSYFFLTRPFTVAFYMESIDFFKSAPVRAPALFYYSLDDPMADPKDMDEVIHLWRSADLDVKVKCWERSVHACHLKEHPEQYLKALEGFVKGLGCGQDEQYLRAKL